MHTKNKFHHSLFSWDFTFSRILQLDWPTVFWPITWEPEFCQIWYWWRNIINNISFHFRSFPGKTNHKILQKIQKKTILGPFWSLFPKLGKNKFSWKKRALSVLKYSNYLPLWKKSEKTNYQFLRKMLNDKQTDR